jgi:predicted RNase H-like HicB family nuclease
LVGGVARKVYTARTARAGRWWAVRVPEVPGVFSQAKTLDKVEYMARDALSAFLGVAPDSFDLVVDVDLPRVRGELDRLRRLRATLERARQEYAYLSAKLTAELAQEGMTVRDIGGVLGVSHQYASRLARSRPAKPRAAVEKTTSSSKTKLPA